MTASEVARWMERHERDTGEVHRDLVRMIQRQDARMEKQDERIEKVDERTDKISTRVSIIFAVVAVLWSIFLVIAPVLRQMLGISQ